MKQKMFMPGMSKTEMKDNLESLAMKMEHGVEYHRPITEEENFIFKDTLAETSIKQVAMNEKLEAIKEEYKNMLAPLKQQWRECVEALTKQSIKIESGSLYLVADEESKQMGYYDENGTLIRTRMLLPEERKMMRIDAGDTVAFRSASSY